MILDIDLHSNYDGCEKELADTMLGYMATDEGDNNFEPYNGMKFDSYQEAYFFYLKYAKLVGFGISTNSSRRSKVSREFIDAKFVYTRYGMKRESNASSQCPYLKINCNVILHV